MNNHTRRKGPWTHRILITILSALLTLLLIWLLGFVLHDINRIEGPQYSEVEKKYVDSSLQDQLKNLQQEQKSVQTDIDNQREIQEILRTSTNNSQQTMNQLLEMHKHNLEQGVKPTEAEQNALAESEQIFMSNQKKFQEANQEIAKLSERLRNINAQILSLKESLREQQKPVRDEFNELMSQHRFMIATLKLGFLIPLLFFAAWFVIKKRFTAYAPLCNASLIAVFWRTGLVMHEHFPREFFKYIAIGAAILIVVAFLVHLIRMIIAPKRDWLIKQYKEAYTKHLCPVCSYPIERGPFKFMTWSNKGPKMKVPYPSGETQREEDQPYSCPSCGRQLYENCKECNSIRPSLLPYCQSCGAEKTLES